MSIHNFDHTLCNTVNEITVMRNNKHCTLKGIDITFQPFHTTQIQMVGWLVQQQNVRFLQKQSCQIDTSLFAAGQRVELLYSLCRCDSKTVANLVHLHVHFIATTGLKTIDKRIIFLQLILCGMTGHCPFQLFHLPFGRCHSCIGCPQNLIDRIATGKLRNLGNQSNLFVGVYKNLATVKIHFSRQDFQKSGFTAAITA